MRNQAKHFKQISSKRKSIIVTAVLLAVVLSVSLVVGVLSRYLDLKESDYQQADAPNFYLTSDLLGDDDQNIPSYSQTVYDLNDATIDFQLRNYRDSLNYSMVDVNYKVFYKVGVAGEYKEHLAGTLEKGSVKYKDLSISMADIGLSGVTTATVYIRVDALPFTKSLYGSFEVTVADMGDITCTVEDSSGANACTVTITTTKKQDVYITIPEECRYDIQSNIPTLKTISSTKVKFTPATWLGEADKLPNDNHKASFTFVFFKTDPSADYSESGFSASHTS